MRVNEMLRETPNLCEVRTLTSIAEELGVTRERIRQILPKPAMHRRVMQSQNKLAADSAKLAAYIESHPLAFLRSGYGGPTFVQIAADLEMTTRRVKKVWTTCGYPSKMLGPPPTMQEYQKRRWDTDPEYRKRHRAAQERWRAKNGERVKESARKADAKYYARKRLSAACQ